MKDVSLTVADGEFMVLLGPSGCGKSSVLRMIAGLEPITSGTVSIDGRVVNAGPGQGSRHRHGVPVLRALSAHERLQQPRLRPAPPRRAAPRRSSGACTGAAAKLGLAPYLERKPHALSGGQRQRVALGRAIVREPKVFLFDEPLSNLDAALRVSTRNELIRQQREIGITTIYVTHDQVEAMTMGHRICIMDKGEVVQIGRRSRSTATPPTPSSRRFLGNPPMNLLPVRDRCRRGWLSVRGLVVYVSGRPTRGRPMRLLRFWRSCHSSAFARRTFTRPRLAPGFSIVAASRRRPWLAVEPLGAETLVVLTLEGLPQEVIARVGRDTKLRPGDAAAFMVDTVAMHVFDTRTMRSIPRNQDRGRGQASG